MKFRWKQGASGVAKAVAHRKPESFQDMTAKDVNEVYDFAENNSAHENNPYSHWQQISSRDPNDPYGDHSKEVVEIRLAVAEDFERAVAKERAIADAIAASGE